MSEFESNMRELPNIRDGKFHLDMEAFEVKFFSRAISSKLKFNNSQQFEWKRIHHDEI